MGSELVCADVLPVFEEYATKDFDDVKIGVLSHLAEFFEVSCLCSKLAVKLMCCVCWAVIA